ncbi:MAG: hypothetical protein MHMPM18_000874 [Marteilia pararefringens]
MDQSSRLRDIFYGKLPKDLLRAILQDCPKGTYVARESQSQAKHLAISYVGEDQSIKSLLSQEPYADLNDMENQIDEMIACAEEDTLISTPTKKIVFPKHLTLQTPSEALIVLDTPDSNTYQVIDNNFEIKNIEIASVVDKITDNPGANNNNLLEETSSKENSIQIRDKTHAPTKRRSRYEQEIDLMDEKFKNINMKAVVKDFFRVPYDHSFTDAANKEVVQIVGYDPDTLLYEVKRNESKNTGKIPSDCLKIIK